MADDGFFPVWTSVYLVVLLISLTATSLAVWSLKRSLCAIQSCVYYATLWYFVWKSLFALSRTALMCAFLAEFRAPSSPWLNRTAANDVGSLRLLGQRTYNATGDSSIPVPTYVVWILFLGDAALLSGVLWMLILVLELTRLAKKTMDRGPLREKQVRRNYLVSTTLIVALYFVLCQVLSKGGLFSNNTKLINIVSNIMQTIVIIAVAFGMVSLRQHGQKFEGVSGEIEQSPLYSRLKRILIVFMMFSLPFTVVNWYGVSAAGDAAEEIPDALLGITQLLYFASGLFFALVMVASQDCFSACMRSRDATRTRSRYGDWAASIAHAPMQNPVFVNTDIESSSYLWGQLGQTMHAAQELHDDLLRSLLVKHQGYEITTCGDAFQLAFHSIPDAVAYCLDVQLQLLHVPWPIELIESYLAGSITVAMPKPSVLPTRHKHPYLFRGLRVRMGIHASSSEEGQLFTNVHPVTQRTTYVGLAEMIGREVSDLGSGGQIIVTARVARFLRDKIESQDGWWHENPCLMQDLGVYRINDLKIDLGIAEVVPLALKDRARLFPEIGNVRSRKSYRRHDSTAYDLLMSPADPCESLRGVEC